MYVVVRLYSGETSLLSDYGLRLTEAAELRISPLVEWELAYLKEVGKISIESTRIRGSLESEIVLRIDETPFGRVDKESLLMHGLEIPST